MESYRVEEWSHQLLPLLGVWLLYEKERLITYMILVEGKTMHYSRVEESYNWVAIDNLRKHKPLSYLSYQTTCNESGSLFPFPELKNLTPNVI